MIIILINIILLIVTLFIVVVLAVFIGLLIHIIFECLCGGYSVNFFNVSAYAAIVLIQAATLPLLWNTIFNGLIIPPLMPALLSAGLFILFLHSVHYNMKVYIVSNAAGLLLNIALLALAL